MISGLLFSEVSFSSTRLIACGLRNWMHSGFFHLFCALHDLGPTHTQASMVDTSDLETDIARDEDEDDGGVYEHDSWLTSTCAAEVVVLQDCSSGYASWKNVPGSWICHFLRA